MHTPKTIGFQPTSLTSLMLVFNPIALNAITINNFDKNEIPVTVVYPYIPVLFIVTITKNIRINHGKMEVILTLLLD